MVYVRPPTLRPGPCKQHGETCQVGLQGGCSLCKRVRYLVETHAKQCKLQGRLCPVPRCADVKEQTRRSGTAQSAMDARRRAAQNSAAKQDSTAPPAAADAAAAASSGGVGGPAASSEASAASGASSSTQTIAAKGAGRSAAAIDFSRLRVLSDADLARFADVRAKLATKTEELLATLSDDQRKQYTDATELTRRKINARIRQDSQLAPDADIPWDAERQHFFEIQCYHDLSRLLIRVREERERATTAALYAATPADGASADPLSTEGGASSTRHPPPGGARSRARGTQDADAAGPE